MNDNNQYKSFDEELPRHASNVLIKDSNEVEFSFKMFTTSDLSNLLESLKVGNEYVLRIGVGKCPADGKIYRNDTLDQCPCKIKKEKGTLSGMYGLLDAHSKWLKHLDKINLQPPFLWRYN